MQDAVRRGARQSYHLAWLKAWTKAEPLYAAAERAFAATGLAAAFVLTRLMEALLFEVRPNDPATLAGVAVLITAVAAVAAFRATRVDPIVALRDE